MKSVLAKLIMEDQYNYQEYAGTDKKKSDSKPKSKSVKVDTAS